MLSKCANPQCSARMKYLHDGSLHVISRRMPLPAAEGFDNEFASPPGRQMECFWLCKRCSRHMTIDSSGVVLDAVPFTVDEVPATTLPFAA